MNLNALKQLLSSVATGAISVDDASQKLMHISYEDIDYAHIDHHRSLRKGFPEVIYGEGKTADQIIGILDKMLDQEDVVLITRVDPEKADKITEKFKNVQYQKDARMLICLNKPLPIAGKGQIVVISAGTSDIPVAKEAYLTALHMGNKVECIFDVGVAGIHRLMGHIDLFNRARVLIVVAGMEGALPSVVAGMVDKPVIAVPTSVGYGVSLGGMTALFGMLNSCSSNIAVVNIDNGFGAGYMASMINRG